MKETHHHLTLINERRGRNIDDNETKMDDIINAEDVFPVGNRHRQRNR